MATEMDLEDAVANVSGDRARQELKEIRDTLIRQEYLLNKVADDNRLYGHITKSTLKMINGEINDKG